MSTRRRCTITTAIAYVNGDPHLGHALELVQADVLARHRRLRGDAVRLATGTDDNALKNVEAAAAAGVPLADFVAQKGDRFVELARALGLSHDDFIRTSTDPRHRPAVDRLWQACASAGDLYRRDYEGLYCVGCEAFVAAAELEDGLCPEHRTAPERVVERNWFFRLSRHEQALLELVASGRLRIEPEHRRNEVLAFVRGGLADFSVSRPRERARGWGIPVPGDPEQVVYVWFDALANYVSALFLVYILLIFVYILLNMMFSLGLRPPYSRWTDAVMNFLRDVCEPYLRIFRRFIPPIGMFDLTPMIAIILLYVVETIVVNAIRG